MEFVWYLLVSWGVVQIITVSRLFSPFRSRWESFIEARGERKGFMGLRRREYVDRFGHYLACPMCVGVPVGIVMSRVLGVRAPVAQWFGAEIGDIVGTVLASFAVSGVAYLLTMVGVHFEEK
jgi:hypothetical protein